MDTTFERDVFPINQELEDLCLALLPSFLDQRSSSGRSDLKVMITKKDPQLSTNYVTILAAPCSFSHSELFPRTSKYYLLLLQVLRSIK